MFVDLTAGRGQVVANKARPLAITLPQRSPLYPDLPALSESFPGFTTTGFLAVAVPKATPRPIQEKLNALINEAITSPDINKRLTDEFALNSPAAHARAVRRAGPRGARQVGGVREDREDRTAVASADEPACTAVNELGLSLSPARPDAGSRTGRAVSAAPLGLG